MNTKQLERANELQRRKQALEDFLEQFERDPSAADHGFASAGLLSRREAPMDVGIRPETWTKIVHLVKTDAQQQIDEINHEFEAL